MALDAIAFITAMGFTRVDLLGSRFGQRGEGKGVEAVPC